MSPALVEECVSHFDRLRQVGHADSKMTMDVNAQLQQRVKPAHGMAFDRLVVDAPPVGGCRRRC